MTMQNNYTAPPPAPTPLCAAYAPMLALLRAASPEPVAEAVRAHVADCAWCRARLATFEVLDGALVRHFGLESAPHTHPSLEVIMTRSQLDDAPPAPAQLPRRRAGLPRRGGALLAVACTLALIVAASVTFSLVSSRVGVLKPIPTPVPTHTPIATVAPTATPLPACAQLPGGANLFTGLPAAPSLQLPAGTYISAPSTTGGGAGKYTVQAYTVCFLGDETAIDGDLYNPPAAPTSALGKLERAGWTFDDLFPDPADLGFLYHGCTVGAKCLHDAGTPNPFTFLGVDQFFTRTGGVTTFRLQVATIGAPVCLNDPRYYAGTPRYTIYEQGNSPSDGNPAYYFFMPAATRVSTFTGGRVPGSTYVYFCSAGTAEHIVSDLEFGMQSDGYAITELATGDFIATKGSHPTYRIEVNAQHPYNYDLRIYDPS
jgi:hypothetical protein